MKFLVDECTGLVVARTLKEMGFDSVSVIDCMKGASDEEIMQRAIEEKRIIISNDKDFARLTLTYKPPGLLLLRLRDERTENKVRVVTSVIAKYGEKLTGRIVVATEKKIRIRPLK